MSGGSPVIEIKNLTKTFPSADGTFYALKNVSLTINDDEIYGIIGMSGAGKSTLVRCINMLERPTEGAVLVNGCDVGTLRESELRKTRREVTMIFQGFHLLMQRTVLRNICFPLELAGVKASEAKARARELLRMVGLPDKENAYPAQLSGGQQQRVAIARTLAPGPKVLFMDEPLSNLDAKLRMEMRTELKRLHRDTDSTFVYVTHDQLEAMTLSTRVCIMQNGLLQQYAPPLEMYNNPANLFVADFMGNPTMNFIEGTAEVNGAAAQLTFGSLHGTFTAKKPISLTGKDVVVGIRPEYIRISDEGTRRATVYSTLPAGMETTVKLDVEGTMLTAVVFGDVDYPVDCPVKFDFSKTAILFDKATGKNVACGTLELK